MDRQPLHYVGLRSEDSATTSTSLVLAERVDAHLELGEIEDGFEKLWDIYAATYEEASAIHALRMGWNPYSPLGEPQPCPNACGCHYYPEGSGCCAICGPRD